MSYEYSFADNIEYGAEDLNKLVRSLVSSGVDDPFTDDVPHNAEVLNGIVQSVCSEGVVPDNVNTLKVSKISNKKISIAPGLAFFKNGSTIRITEAHEMDFVPGETNYVYLKQDLTEKNQNYPVCSTEKPAYNDDVVLLAEIDGAWNVIDKRKYASGKYPGYKSNANGTVVVEKNFVINKNTHGKEGSISFTIDMGTNNYSRVFVIVDSSLSNEKPDGRIGVYSLTDKTYFCASVYDEWGQIFTGSIKVGDSSGHEPRGSLTFSQTDNVLNCVLSWCSVSNLEYFPFKIILC